MTLQTVVIPTDGSVGSDLALDYGGRLAAQLGARVVVVNVSAPLACEAARAGQEGSANHRQAQELAPALARAVDVLATLGVTPTLCLRAGEPWREIVAEGERRPRSMVVMASRGSVRQRASRTPGSVAGRVARNSECPVLIIPLVAGTVARPPTSDSTILLPLDGSELAELALPPAEALAVATHARLLLLRVQEAPDTAGTPVGEMWLTERAAAERRYLEVAAKQPRLHGIEVDTDVLAGPPAYVIQEVIDAVRPCLVVMTTHGRGSIDRWLVGNVADAIIDSATVPLLLVNPLGYHGEETALNRTWRHAR